MKYLVSGLLFLTMLSMTDLSFGKIGVDIKKYSTNAGELVWMEDDRFPTFTISIYFADGSLSDDPSKIGETAAMFELFTSGTNRYNQKNIAEHLEYYGVSYGSDVTHEYSKFEISGLVKDVVPVLKMVCHNFREAIFPEVELKKYQRKVISGLSSISTDPSAMAERAFRMISLQGTSFEMPASGVIKTIKRIGRKDLQGKLDYFNKKVKKSIYLAGPESLIDIKEIFSSECGWNTKENTFERVAPPVLSKDNTNGPSIYLVTVPKSNQGQIRIGRYLSQEEVKDKVEIMSFASSFLAGGFTSKLMQELRVKRGLTYGVSAYLSGQKFYGRSGITTSIRNEKVAEGISVIKETLQSITPGNITEDEILRLKGYLSGGYLFQFEKVPYFLNKVAFYDHMGLDYNDIYNYPQIINAFTKGDLAKAVEDYFAWNKQRIVVLGSSTLLKDLESLGKVKVVNYKDYL